VNNSFVHRKKEPHNEKSHFDGCSNPVFASFAGSVYLRHRSPRPRRFPGGLRRFVGNGFPGRFYVCRIGFRIGFGHDHRTVRQPRQDRGCRRRSPGAPANNGSGIGAGNGAGGIRPTAFGTIAALSSGTVQVQNSTAQTTVKYTGATTFSTTTTSTLAAVKVGSCITAAAARTSTAGGGPTSGTTAAPTTRTAITALTATTVQISAPVAGACTGGFGARTRSTVRASDGAAPTGAAAPSAGASGGTGGAGGSAGGRRTSGAVGERAFGKVTAVTQSSIVVEQTNRTTKAASTVTVTVTGTTAFTATSTTNSSVLKVGLCAVAVGTADSTGAVAAKSIAVSPASSNGCNGFGAGGFGGRGGRQKGGDSPVTTNG
jgi:hypothetical protein